MNELAIWAVSGFGFLAAVGWGLALYYRSLLVALEEENRRQDREVLELREQVKQECRERLDGLQVMRRAVRTLAPAIAQIESDLDLRANSPEATPSGTAGAAGG